MQLRSSHCRSNVRLASQSAYVVPTPDDAETQPEINCLNVVFFSSIISSFEVFDSIFSARDTRDSLHDERKAR